MPETGIRKLSEKQLKDLGFEREETFEVHIHFNGSGGTDEFSIGIPRTSFAHSVEIGGRTYLVLRRVDDDTNMHDGSEQNSETYYLRPIDE